jgi:hypothetical protein
MTQSNKIQLPVGTLRLACLAMAFAACGGGPVMSGVAVGKVGRGLSVHAHAVPPGSEVCSFREAIVAPTAGERPVSLSEACQKTVKSGLLWRHTLVVLAAYAERLEAIASGTAPETAGQLEAALIGPAPPESDNPSEQAARNAAAQLVSQMATVVPKGDLDKAVKDAAPQVSILCTGLAAYFEAQAKSLGDTQRDIDRKRTTKSDRRCGGLDNRTVCVSESVIDRLVYASVSSHIATLDNRYGEARDATATFCAAHRKLEEGAAAGPLSKDKYYTEILDAVKAARRAEKPADKK